MLQMDTTIFMVQIIPKQAALILKEVVLLMFIDLEIQKVMIQKFSSLIPTLRILSSLGMIQVIQLLLVI